MLNWLRYFRQKEDEPRENLSMIISATACSIPEIVSNILIFLRNHHPTSTEQQTVPDRQCLFACALVNRLWASEATTILWTDSPPLEAIRALIPPGDPRYGDVDERRDDPEAVAYYERMDWYTSKVRSLSITDNDKRSHYAALKAVRPKFPILQTLALTGRDSHYLKRGDLVEFIQPTLRELELADGYVSRFTLNLVIANCPNLTKFCIGYTYGKAPTEKVLDFLLGCTSLTHIELYSPRITNEATVQHLLTRPRLQHLHLQMTLPHVEYIEENAEQIFPDLHTLEIHCDHRVIQTMCMSSILKSLERLEVFIDSVFHTAIQPIATHCPNLKYLWILYKHRQQPLGPQDLRAITLGLKNLTTLGLVGLHDWHYEGVNIKVMNDFAQSFPYLTSLTLICHTTSSRIWTPRRTSWGLPDSPRDFPKFYTIIGCHCRQLRLLNCRWDIDTDLFAEPSTIDYCVFPKLVHLTTSGFVRTSIDISLKEFEKSLWVMKEHMPRLRTFQVNGVDKEKSAKLNDFFTLMAELPWP